MQRAQENRGEMDKYYEQFPVPQYSRMVSTH